MRILLVDDEAILLMLYKTELEACGYRVETTTEGEKALALIEDSYRMKTPFDLIVLDILMVGMGGIEVLNTIKRKWPELTVFILSAYDHKDMDDLSKADAYFVKTSDLTEVIERIKEGFSQISA